MHNNDIVDAPLHAPESDYLFSQGAYFAIQFRLFAFAVLAAGLQLLFINHNIFGFVIVVAALIVILAKKVLTFSFSLERYRYTLRLFKWDFGRWESFPAFESISVFSAKKSQEMSTGHQFGRAVFSEIEVNLVYNRSRRLTVFTTDNAETALMLAKRFGTRLEIPVYNALGREGFWMDGQV